jgi:hypothetical protein
MFLKIYQDIDYGKLPASYSQWLNCYLIVEDLPTLEVASVKLGMMKPRFSNGEPACGPLSMPTCSASSICLTTVCPLALSEDLGA